jgi:hypothetical protein
MKATVASHQPTTSKDRKRERDSVCERCFLSLLSSALSQFEVRDDKADLQLLYRHAKLETLSEKAEQQFDANNQLSGAARQKAFAATEKRSTKLTSQMFEADEELRMDVLVRRCHRMAEIATAVWFEEEDFASAC